MKPLNPTRLHTALRGEPRAVGIWVPARLAVRYSQTALRSGARFGGLPVPNH